MFEVDLLIAGRAVPAAIGAMAAETGASPLWAGFNLRQPAGVVLVLDDADLDAAVACANHSASGLSAGVFGRDRARALQVARRIDSGIHEFTELRRLTVQTTPRHDPS